MIVCGSSFFSNPIAVEDLFLVFASIFDQNAVLLRLGFSKYGWP